MSYSESDILILTANYGSGHRQVARALAESLHKSRPGLEFTILDYSAFLDPFIQRLTRAGYYHSIRHFPIGYHLYYQATDTLDPDSFWQRRLNHAGLAKFTRALSEIRPKVVVATFPLAAGVLSHLRKTGVLSVPVITVITDYVVHNQWIHPFTDHYIVASDEVADGLRQRGVPLSKIVASGIPVLPAYAKPWTPNEARRRLGLDPERKTLLFMGGGDGIFGLNPLNLLKDDGHQGIILTGRNKELYEQLSYVRESSPSWRVLGELDDAMLPMCAADLLVTKAGGVTVSEALALGLPMILVHPLPGQEVANARYLRRHRAALVSRDPKRTEAHIHHLLDNDAFRHAMGLNAERLGHPHSGEFGAALILQSLQGHINSPYAYTKARRENRG